MEREDGGWGWGRLSTGDSGGLLADFWGGMRWGRKGISRRKEGAEEGGGSQPGPAPALAKSEAAPGTLFPPQAPCEGL